jgi:hypothetical protein
MNRIIDLTRIVGADVKTKNRKNAHAGTTAIADPQPSPTDQPDFSGPLTYNELMHMPQDSLSRENGFTSPDQRFFFQAILSQVGPGESQPGHPRPAVSALATFGVYVGGCRRRKGLSLAQMAERSGLPVDHLVMIELGQVNIEETAAAVPQIAAALEADPMTFSAHLAGFLLPTKKGVRSSKRREHPLQ